MRPNDELLQKIGQVRSKWKAFVWMRGLAWVLGLLVVALAVGIYLATVSSVSTAAIRNISLLFAGAIVAAAVWKLFLPLRRVPNDTQLAQFVEKKNPGLEQSLVSAVEEINKPRADHGAFSFLLIKDALERTKNVRFGDTINKRKFNMFAATNGALILAVVVGFLLASLFLSGSLARCLYALGPVPTVDKMTLTVQPGSVTVPKGSDVQVTAQLTGYDQQKATIYFMYKNSKKWSSAEMDVKTDSDKPAYQFRLFNLQEQVKYYVDISGKRSDEFTVKVADLPRVEKLDYTYNFPGYTGMPPKKEENAYDMYALKGTVVEVNATSNQELKSGRIVFADGKSIEMAPSGDKQVMGKVTLDRKTTFRIELTNKDGEKYLGLEEFRMEPTEDQKPVVHFVKPGRDYRASNLEEVFTEAKADDDFGVASLELFYSVNGGKEQKVDLFKGSPSK